MFSDNVIYVNNILFDIIIMMPMYLEIKSFDSCYPATILYLNSWTPVVRRDSPIA